MLLQETLMDRLRLSLSCLFRLLVREQEGIWPQGLLKHQQTLNMLSEFIWTFKLHRRRVKAFDSASDLIYTVGCIVFSRLSLFLWTFLYPVVNLGAIVFPSYLWLFEDVMMIWCVFKWFWFMWRNFLILSRSTCSTNSTEWEHRMWIRCVFEMFLSSENDVKCIFYVQTCCLVNQINEFSFLASFLLSSGALYTK